MEPRKNKSKKPSGGDISQRPARCRARNWVFTIITEPTYSSQSATPDNHEGPTTGGVDDSGRFWDPECVAWDNDVVRYVIAGLETCPSTGKLHWQGYLETRVPTDMSTVKILTNCPWAHLESRRGSQEQAIDYVRKEDTGVLDEDGNKVLFEIGQQASNGKRGASSKNQNYARVLEAPTYQEALQLCQELEPADYVRFHSAVKRGLTAHFLKVEVFIRPRDQFIQEFISDDVLKRFAVVFTGASS